MNDRIREIRKNANLSMDKFGERIGIKRSSVSLLESGKNSPSKRTVKLICKEFNVNENWLYTGEGEMYVKNTKEERYKLNLDKLQQTDDETIIRWVNTIAETNPSMLKTIEQFMIMLLEKDGISVHRKE